MEKVNIIEEEIKQQTLCFLELFNNHDYEDIYKMFEKCLDIEYYSDYYNNNLTIMEQNVALFLSGTGKVENEYDKKVFLSVYKKTLLYIKKDPYFKEEDFNYIFSSFLQRMWDLSQGNFYDALIDLDETERELIQEVFYGNKEIYIIKEKIINSIAKNLKNIENVSKIEIVDKNKKISFFYDNKKMEIIVPTPTPKNIF